MADERYLLIFQGVPAVIDAQARAVIARIELAEGIPKPGTLRWQDGPLQHPTDRNQVGVWIKDRVKRHVLPAELSRLKLQKDLTDWRPVGAPFPAIIPTAFVDSDTRVAIEAPAKRGTWYWWAAAVGLAAAGAGLYSYLG